MGNLDLIASGNFRESENNCDHLCLHCSSAPIATLWRNRDCRQHNQRSTFTLLAQKMLNKRLSYSITSLLIFYHSAFIYPFPRAISPNPSFFSIRRQFMIIFSQCIYTGADRVKSQFFFVHSLPYQSLIVILKLTVDERLSFLVTFST